jgi:hypothetical protein
MVEAVRTTQSTFGIWVIVAVAMIVLAIWLVGIYIADSYQTRLSRQRRMGAPGPALGGAGGPASAIPGQRREAGQPEPAPEPEPGPEPELASDTVAARGRHARPGTDYYAAADYYATADYKAAEKPPAGHPETRPRGVGDPETGSQADAPTRPDLPAQAGPTGRHAMPAQRSGDSDRAERTYAGPDANREDDEDGQDGHDQR